MIEDLYWFAVGGCLSIVAFMLYLVWTGLRKRGGSVTVSDIQTIIVLLTVSVIPYMNVVIIGMICLWLVIGGLGYLISHGIALVERTSNVVVFNIKKKGKEND